MKESMKKRLAVFLCILFVLPAIMAVLPQTAQEVQAAKASLYWDGTLADTKGKITVENGMAFYIGDYAYVSYKSSYITSTLSMVKASYSTSKKNIATVNSKGYVEAKETGSTKIKIKYKGKTLICTLTVVEPGSFGTKKAYTKLAKAANTIAKKMPSNITTSNGFNLIKSSEKYEEVADSVNSDITSDGFIIEKLPSGSDELKEDESYDNRKTTQYLAVPNAGRYNTLWRKLRQYAEKNSPFSTTSSKVLKITSASATTDKASIYLAKAPSKEQILAVLVYSYSSYPKKNKSAQNGKVYFDIYINDSLNWFCCMNTGSRMISAIPQKYNVKKYEYVNTKLKKNKTYRIGYPSDWTKGMTVTVK